MKFMVFFVYAGTFCQEAKVKVQVTVKVLRNKKITNFNTHSILFAAILPISNEVHDFLPPLKH